MHLTEVAAVQVKFCEKEGRTPGREGRNFIVCMLKEVGRGVEVYTRYQSSHVACQAAGASRMSRSQAHSFFNWDSYQGKTRGSRNKQHGEPSNVKNPDK